MFPVILLILYLTAGAVADIRHKSVSRRWIWLGAGLTILLIFGQILTASDAGETLRRSLYGAVAALPFLAVSLISPRHLGLADGIALLMIGLVTGARCTALTLFIALVLAVILGIAQLVRQRGGAWRQQSLAFLPCLTFGLIGAQFL